MTDYLESASGGTRGHGIAINCEGVFQALPGNKIAEGFSGIQDASSGLELGGIDNRAWAGIRKMFFSGAVTALTSDRLRGEYWGAILVQCASNVQCGSGVAKDTFFADRAGEIWVRLIFVARRQIVGLATLVVGDGGLEKAAAQLDEIALGVVA
jgi:hypothetical protein